MKPNIVKQLMQAKPSKRRDIIVSKVKTAVQKKQQSETKKKQISIVKKQIGKTSAGKVLKDKGIIKTEPKHSPVAKAAIGAGVSGVQQQPSQTSTTKKKQISIVKEQIGKTSAGKVLKDKGIIKTEPDKPKYIPGMKIISQQHIGTIQYIQDYTKFKQNIEDINPEQQYQLSEPIEGIGQKGDIVSGDKLRSHYETVLAGYEKPSKEMIVSSSKGISPTGLYIQKEGQYYQTTPEMRYLIKHSKPGESEKLLKNIGKAPIPPEGFVGPVADPFTIQYEKTFTSMPPSKQIDYLRKFTDTPVMDLKYHPAFSTYRTGLTYEQRMKKALEYAKAHPEEKFLLPIGQGTGLTETMTKGGLGVTPGQYYSYSDIQKFKEEPNIFLQALAGVLTKGKTTGTTKYSTAEKILSEAVTRKMFYTESELASFAKQSYDQMNPLQRISIAGTRAFASGVTFPITLGETIITGGKGGPVSKSFVATDIGAPHGIMSTGTSELFSGGKSDAWERMQKYPIESFFATIGEFGGLYYGSKPISYGIGKIKPIVQPYISPYITRFKIGTGQFYKGIKTNIKPYTPPVIKTGFSKLFKKVYPGAPGKPISGGIISRFIYESPKHAGLPGKYLRPYHSIGEQILGKLGIGKTPPRPGGYGITSMIGLEKTSFFKKYLSPYTLQRVGLVTEKRSIGAITAGFKKVGTLFKTGYKGITYQLYKEPGMWIHKGGPTYQKLINQISKGGSGVLAYHPNTGLTIITKQYNISKPYGWFKSRFDLTETINASRYRDILTPTISKKTTNVFKIGDELLIPEKGFFIPGRKYNIQKGLDYQLKGLTGKQISKTPTAGFYKINKPIDLGFTSGGIPRISATRSESQFLKYIESLEAPYQPFSKIMPRSLFKNISKVYYIPKPTSFKIGSGIYGGITGSLGGIRPDIFNIAIPEVKPSFKPTTGRSYISPKYKPFTGFQYTPITNIDISSKIKPDFKRVQDIFKDVTPIQTPHIKPAVKSGFDFKKAMQQDNLQINIPKTTNEPIFESISTHGKLGKPWWWFPKASLGGRGTISFPTSKKPTKYRFRKFDIGDITKINQHFIKMLGGR